MAILSNLSAEIADTLRTDKDEAGLWPFYAELLAARRNSVRGIVEIGVLNGNTIITLARYCPHAVCLGVDSRHAPHEFAEIRDRLGLTGRVHFLLSEQTDAKIPAVIRRLCADGVNLIIDDASHMMPETARTFALLWPLLAWGGWYVIEDWSVSYEDACRPKYAEGKPKGVAGIGAFVKTLCDRIHAPLDMIERAVLVRRAAAFQKAPLREKP